MTADILPLDWRDDDPASARTEAPDRAAHRGSPQRSPARRHIPGQQVELGHRVSNLNTIVCPFPWTGGSQRELATARRSAWRPARNRVDRSATFVCVAVDLADRRQRPRRLPPPPSARRVHPSRRPRSARAVPPSPSSPLPERVLHARRQPQLHARRSWEAASSASRLQPSTRIIEPKTEACDRVRAKLLGSGCPRPYCVASVYRLSASRS